MTTSLSQKNGMLTFCFVKSFLSFSFYPYPTEALLGDVGGPLPTTPAAPAPAIQYEGYHFDPPKDKQLTYPINIRISQEKK
jgi:hypothetical protein